MLESFAAYQEAFSTDDPERIPGLVEDAFAEDAVFESEMASWVGRLDIAQGIAAFKTGMPNAKMRLTSQIQRAGGSLRVTWTYDAADGPSVAGMTVAVLDETGRIARLTSFAGLAPPPLA